MEKLNNLIEDLQSIIESQDRVQIIHEEHKKKLKDTYNDRLIFIELTLAKEIKEIHQIIDRLIMRINAVESEVEELEESINHG